MLRRVHHRYGDEGVPTNRPRIGTSEPIAGLKVATLLTKLLP
jgi:hypothetical protein